MRAALYALSNPRAEDAYLPSMPFRIRTLALVAALAPGLAGAPLAAQVTVTHVANAGFLLAAGESRVLVDALFDDGIAGYGQIPDELRPALEGGREPFTGVDLVLATHEHRDHFAAGSVRRFLEANPAAIFVSTPQAVDAVKTVAGSEVASRVVAVLPEAGRIEHLELPLDGIEVHAFNLHHGIGSTTQNLGFLVTLGGVSVLHVGDAEASAEEFRALRLNEVAVDYAFLTSWLVSGEPWGRPVLEAIGTGRIGVMHVATQDAPASWFGDAGGLAELERRILATAPAAEIFTSPLQSSSCCSR